MGQDTKRQSIFSQNKNWQLHHTATGNTFDSKNWENSTSNSQGVATLFPPNVDYIILEKYSDNNGRFLLVKCKCEEIIYNN